MKDHRVSEMSWNDVEIGLRIVSGSLAIMAALFVGPALSHSAVYLITDYSTEFYGEMPTLETKMITVASCWGFVFGMVFGASGWLRYLLLPRFRKRVDAVFFSKFQ